MFSKFLSLESERRNAILNAALKEFAGRGFDDASTNVIAKESGISWDRGGTGGQVPCPCYPVNYI